MFENLKKEAIIVTDEHLDKEEVLSRIIMAACKAFAISDCESILSAIIDRESKLSTGIGLGIAVPHCRSDKVQKIAIAVMLLSEGIEYNSVDGQPVKLIFLIISPLHDVQGHIAALSTISHAVSDEEARMRLINSKSEDELFANLTQIRSWE
ncbi:MAG: PTS sugar transporter subunit IIA [Candidatus Latescibacterota bacterium]